jgi:NAD(P)H-dependent flavin oxidoreductase YrpB (nitropropane dioxygenase family)
MMQSRLAQRLGLKYPILQAPIGSMTGVDLAAAVSNEGGLGSLALAWTAPGLAQDMIRQLQSKTTNSFFVNYVLAFPIRSLDLVLEAGVPMVTFSWGNPGPLIEKCHQASALVGVQVGTCDGAKSARDSGADFIICQGVEAGGHVQSTTPLMSLLEETVEACEDMPVVATGGLANGEDIAEAFHAGADAVMLGTRFIATVESRAHPLYKQALVDSQSENAVISLCFNGGWDHAPHRTLRNSTLKAWEDAGCPPVGFRPGEMEQIAFNSTGKIVTRYDDTQPAFDMDGDILAC